MALRVPRRDLGGAPQGAVRALIRRRAGAVRVAVLASACAAALALPAAGRARDVAIAVGPPPPYQAELRIRERLWALGVDAEQVDVVFGADPLLGDAAVGVLGDAVVTACGGEPMDRATFEARLDVADEHVAFAEHHEALAALAALRERIPCLTETVEPERLHRLHLLEGVAQWFVGDREAAREAFVRAVMIDPGYHWGGEFGPGPQELNVDAERTVLARAPATLWVGWSEEGATVAVDGRPVELSDGGGVVELPAGPHLLQVVAAGAEPFVRLLEVRDEVVVIDRGALERGLAALVERSLDGPGWPTLAAVSLWMLASGYDDGWIALTPDAVRARRSADRGDGMRSRHRSVRVDPVRGELRAPAVLGDRLRGYAWQGAVSLEGFHLHYLRAGDETPYEYGKVATTVLFPTLPNMALGFSVGLAVRWDADLGRSVFLIPLGARMRLSPDHGPVRPYLELAATALWLGQRDGPQFAMGPQGGGGVVVRPFDRKVLGFVVGGRAGFVGGVTLDVDAGVSLQW